MIANEFRIGNYVFSKMVEDIIKLSALLESQDLQVEPILLTEDILLNCGFQVDGVWIHLTKNLEHKRMIGFDMENMHVFVSQLNNDNKFRDVFLGKFKYLHQLQNLYFALTNEELNIEL